MIALYIVIVLCIFALALTGLLHILRSRSEKLRLRAMERSSNDINAAVNALLADKSLALEFQKRLNTAMDTRVSNKEVFDQLGDPSTWEADDIAYQEKIKKRY